MLVWCQTTGLIFNKLKVGVLGFEPMEKSLLFFKKGACEMPRSLITNINLAVGAGGFVDLQPAVGVEWLVTDFASDEVFVTNVPDLQVSLYDGATECIALIDPTTDPGNRIRQYKFYLTNAVYMRITNTGGAGHNVGYFGEIVTPGLTRSAIAVIAPANFIVIQPPDGETWEVTEWGMSVFTVAGDLNPAVEVGLTDGVLIASRLILPTMVRGQDKQKSIFINHATYLYVYSTPGGSFAYCARRVPPTCISFVFDVAGSATLDIQPPVGDQWVITDVGAETWAGGGAPNDYPDITVAVRTTGNSNIMEAGSIATSLRWNHAFQLKIDNTHFLRITEVSAGNNEVCVSGYLERSY